MGHGKTLTKHFMGVKLLRVFHSRLLVHMVFSGCGLFPRQRFYMVAVYSILHPVAVPLFFPSALGS